MILNDHVEQSKVILNFISLSLKLWSFIRKQKPSKSYKPSATNSNDLIGTTNASSQTDGTIFLLTLIDENKIKLKIEKNLLTLKNFPS